MTCTIKLNEAK